MAQGLPSPPVMRETGMDPVLSLLLWALGSEATDERAPAHSLALSLFFKQMKINFFKRHVHTHDLI